VNRWDEIYASALDCVGATGPGDAEGRRRAADLIKLIGLMVNGVGNAAASHGECMQCFARHAVDCTSGPSAAGSTLSACGDYGLYNGYHMDTCTVPDRDGMVACGMPSFAPNTLGGEHCRLQPGHLATTRHQDGTASWPDRFINPTDHEFCPTFDGTAGHRARWVESRVCRICGRKKPMAPKAQVGS
jgi:hypothetical protein